MILLILTLISAPASALEFGIGARAAVSAMDDPGLFDGPRLVVRQPVVRDVISVDASAFVRMNPTLPRDSSASYFLDSANEAGVQTSKLQVPVSTDKLSFSLGLDLPGGILGTAGRWTGGPHLLGGLELRGFEVTDLGYDGGVVKTGDSGLQWGFCLPMGLGAEIDMGRHLALRGALLYRFAFEEPLDLTPAEEEHDATETYLDRNVTATVDVFIHL